MWLLITFIIIWALSPGPVCFMTIQEARKYGALAGVSVSAGAAVTSVLMVLAGIIVYGAGFTAVLDSDGMFVVEKIGALGIILMGLYSGHKCLFNQNRKSENDHLKANRFGFFQGMTLMAAYIPQALLFYNVIVPQSVESGAIFTAIIALGTLKVILIFVWHSGIAFVATRAQNIMHNNRFGRLLEATLACLIMGMGVNILL